MEQEYETLDLREIFYLIKNNIILIVASCVACTVLGFAVTAIFVTPIYQASATMIVNTRADQNAVVTYDQLNSAKQLVGTYSIILKSDTVLDKVIKNLNLTAQKGMEEINALQLAQTVEVVGIDSTQVIKISVKHKDAQIAKAIVQEIVRLAPESIVSMAKAGSVELISAPRAFESPVYPNKMLNTAIAGFVGAVVSLGFVIIKDMFNNTITSETDIQKYLGLTVLGVIPRIEIEE